MKHVQKKIWLPWTSVSVWNALTDLSALASWAQLSVCGDAPKRSLAPGAVLRVEKTRWTSSWWLVTLTVEQMYPHRAILCSFSTRAFQGNLDIRLSPEEGDEATTIVSRVTVECIALRGGFRIGAPLMKGMIQRRVAQAFRKLDALLEYRQEQAELGTNAVYRSWQRIQTERELFRRELMLQSMRYHFR